MPEKAGEKKRILGGLLSKMRKKSSLFYDYNGTEELVTENFPLLPLRDLVLFPQTMVPIFITYKPGISAIEEAIKRDSRLFAACLKKMILGFLLTNRIQSALL